MGVRFPFASFPRGWFAAVCGEDVAAGAVRTVHRFGQDIVVFRGESGALAAVDHACPHLGAHLGVGWVEADCLRCPVHAWAFDGSGRCVEIPGVSRIPAKAAVAAWPLREQDGVALIYHCPTGAAPTWEPPALQGEGWTTPRSLRRDVASHPQEVAEAVIDGVQRRAGAAVAAIEEAGPTLRLRWVAADGEFAVTLHGLGVVVATHTTAAGTTRRRVYAAPITDERAAIAWQVEATDEALAAADHLALLAELTRELPMLETKAYLEQPTLVAGDGPIARFRRWARGLYGAARADAAAREQRGAQVRLGEWLRRSTVAADGEAGPDDESPEAREDADDEVPPDRLVH